MMVEMLAMLPSHPVVVAPRKLCGVCGGPEGVCPTCEGHGEAYVDDGRFRPYDHPDENIRPQTCPTCKGKPGHICLPYYCDLCGDGAIIYDAEIQRHLCWECNERLGK
jgi:hypothetical protein